MTGKGLDASIAPTTVSLHFDRVSHDGTRAPHLRHVAVEMPVSIEVNGIGYAVLMATPDDFSDLAVGFALGERLIDEAHGIRDIHVFPRVHDAIIRVTVRADLAARVRDRVRHRATDRAPAAPRGRKHRGR